MRKNFLMIAAAALCGSVFAVSVQEAETDWRKLNKEKVSQVYPGAVIRYVSLSKNPSKENYFTGRVVFSRKGRTYERPADIIYCKDGTYLATSTFSYRQNGKYLLEDADIFFDDLKKQIGDDWKNARCVGTKLLRPGVLRFKVEIGEESGDVDIEFTEKKDKDGVWEWSWRVLEAK